MSDRRQFLKQSLLTTGGLAAASSLLAKGAGVQPAVPEVAYKQLRNQQVVVSTWDFGQEANEAAWHVLQQGARAVDAVEAGVRVPEADPENQTVGYGGRPDRDGRVTLDACIMDEHYRCGAVAGMEHIMHAISVARQVMEKTPHVMLVGDGALQFALANGFTKQRLLTAKSEAEWKEWLNTSEYKPQRNVENMLPGGKYNHDTIGMLAMDAKGNMGGACTTSGMAYKLHGRVGDSPIIGAGLYVDNEVGAATSSGVGEEVIRIVGSHLVVELMRMGLQPEEACRKAVERIARRNPEFAKETQVGFLALNKHGEYGAFALQQGFSFAVRTHTTNEIHQAKSLFGG